MRNLVFLLALIASSSLFNATTTCGQGVSVSYLIPQNGLLSAPVSPFSVRNVRLPFNDYLGIQTGGSLYIFPGIPMGGLPFESDETLRGSTFGIITPLEAYIGVGSSQFSLILSGGVFGLGFFNNRLDQGAWDRTYLQYQDWELANGQLSLQNRLGWGWLAGLSLEVPINRKFALSTGVNYLSGSSSSTVSGNFRGFDYNAGIVSNEVEFKDARTELNGIEISFGVSF